MDCWVSEFTVRWQGTEALFGGHRCSGFGIFCIFKLLFLRNKKAVR